MKGPSHLGLSLFFSSPAGVELVRQRYRFWPVLLCFDTFKPITDRMRNGLLPCRAPPPGPPNCPVDQARLLSLHTCALEVSHELCRKAAPPQRCVYPIVRFALVRSPHSTESSSSTQCVFDSFKDRTNLGLMPLMTRPFARST